jgi:uncharacterized FAD-dependent dehydrogenase
MITELDLVCIPALAADATYLKQEAAKKLHLTGEEITDVRVLRISIDARKKPILFNQKVMVGVGVFLPPDELTQLHYQKVANKKRVIIIGFGPAGMFAALRLIELGIKPIVIERGSDVRTRRRDLKAITRDHTVNPESNYCFGEGGAGTYSDGKLYTRSNKRGNVGRILDILVHHGATPAIRTDAHPHIGTNKLPSVVQAIRETVLEHGGEIYFDTKMVDFTVANGRFKSIITQNGDAIEGDAMILATGHSARDIYELLHKKGIAIEAKPFAMGVRVEHPQDLIDKIQYHGEERGDVLPAASYKLVHQAQGRGVYSFCMCPGGFIVPAATAQGEVVVNGMSPSRRDSKFANSGIVVGIELQDLKPWQKHGPLAGLRYQQMVEQNVCAAGGNTQTAPAQRLTDFVHGKISTSLNESSYIPGLASVEIGEVLPAEITSRLREGFTAFGRKMRGYLTDEANIVATESRTSSPVRIPRNAESLQHPEVGGLYPSGEGGGYAGGIVSAAMDGERVAEKIWEALK